MPKTARKGMKTMRLGVRGSLRENGNVAPRSASSKLNGTVGMSALALENARLRRQLEELQSTATWLDQSRSEFAKLFNAMPIGFVIIDQNGLVRRCNQRFIGLLQAKITSVVQGPFILLVSKADVPKYLKHLRSSRIAGPVSTQVSLRTFSGAYVPVELVSIPTEFEPGHHSKVIYTAIIDLRERQAAEQALAQTQNDYHAVVDTIEGIVWEADAQNSEITFVSRSAERILGHPLQKWYQLGFWESHIYVEDRERVKNLLSRAMAEHMPLVTEYRMIAADRRLVWLQGTMTLREHRGRLKIYGVAVDITKRKAVEQQLRETQETLEQRVDERTKELRATVAELESFSYSLSHDLRAPLRAMQGYAHLLHHRFGDLLGTTGRDYLQRVMSSTERLDHLVTDVLQYSRLARAPVAVKEVDLNRLLTAVIHDYPAFQAPRADIEVQTPLLPVRGHEAFLTQCLSNLISNAIKFVPSGQQPRLRIWTQPRHGSVLIWFEDNGIGIRPEDQKRIFGLFSRVHSQDRFEGTGIGLAIVQKAAERMGGAVGVESNDGQGSKFWLQLPAV